MPSVKPYSVSVSDRRVEEIFSDVNRHVFSGNGPDYTTRAEEGLVANPLAEYGKLMKWIGDRPDWQGVPFAAVDFSVPPPSDKVTVIIRHDVDIDVVVALRESVELRHAPLGLWLQDLSAPDPLFILPLLMAFIMFMTQKLAPPMPGSDPTQVAVMKFMPVMFSIFFIFLPSGLVLYSVTNALVTYLQQVLIYKTVGAKLSE